jgi:hypothetical protein
MLDAKGSSNGDTSTPIATTAQPRVLGEAKDFYELIEIYRDRKAELGLTDKFFDDYSGLACGHISKLIGEAKAKNLGAASVNAINATLAVKFIVVVDHEQEAFMRDRWEGRKSGRPIKLAMASKRAIERFRPIIMLERGRALAPLGGRARAAKLSPRRRSQIARLAARARWARKAG